MLTLRFDAAPDAAVHVPLLVEYTGRDIAADVTARMVDDAKIDPDQGFTIMIVDN